MINGPAPVAEWLPPPEKVSLSDGQLDIWLLVLDKSPCEPAYLDTEETLRINNLSHNIGRQQYCAAHTATRMILGRYLNRPPREVPLNVASGGKPRINKFPPPSISTCHTLEILHCWQ